MCQRAWKCLKLGKSGGPDELTLEHIVYNMVARFTRSFEKITKCMKEGLVIPFSKKQGKDPLLVNNYRRIMYSLLCACCHRLFKLSFCSNRKTGVPRSIANHLLKEYFLHRCHLCYSRDFHKPPARWRAALPMSISHWKGLWFSGASYSVTASIWHWGQWKVVETN